MIQLSRQYFWKFLLPFLLIFMQRFLTIEAFLKATRVEEIPFSLTDKDPVKLSNNDPSHGIHAITSFEKSRGFFHLFHVPHIVCFFAAKGKWPFIPPLIQGNVDAAAQNLFVQNDGFIKKFCQKYFQIKQCFRPLFATATISTVEALSKVRATPCSCANKGSIVYFDRDHIGNVDSETVLNTIEFLESFLPDPPKKTKRRKNRVRGRIDEMEVE